MVVTFVWFILGLVLLGLGGDLLVRGASRLAAAVGISPLVVGLTVVAYGTGSPELAVSAKAAVAGVGDLAVGNVIGSNICNVLLVLGLAATVAPLRVASQLIRFDLWVMVLVSVLVWLVSLDGSLSRVDGLIFVLLLILYTGWSIFKSRRERSDVQKQFEAEFGVASEAKPRRATANFILVTLGIGLLVLGADWLVQAAVEFATYFEISPLVIGLTVVAVGTSLPEIATSVVASVRGERDIAVGNVVGSNTFNILGVLGLSALISPSAVEVARGAISFDMPVMIGVAILCLPIFFTGYRIARGEGLLFLFYYVAYLTYLVLDAKQHALLKPFEHWMQWIVIPATIAGLVVTVVMNLREKGTSLISSY